MDRFYHKVSRTIYTSDPLYGQLVMPGSNYAVVKNFFYCGPASDVEEVLTPSDEMQHFFWFAFENSEIARGFCLSKESIEAEIEFISAEIDECKDDPKADTISFLRQIIEREPGEESYEFVVL
jgi:hypothetical protein